MPTNDEMQKLLKQWRIREVARKGEVRYVVNATVDGHRHQAEFEDLETAIDYAKHRNACEGRGVSPMTGPRFKKRRRNGGDLLLADEQPLTELLERITAVRQDLGGRLRTLERFLSEFGTDLVASTVTPEVTQKLPTWLQEQRYTKRAAGRVLKAADEAWDMLIGMDKATRNRWKGLKPKKKESELDRNGKLRIKKKAPAFEPTILVAVAHLLRPCYLLAFWLTSILGLRRSEAMGLRLADWEPPARRLTVTGQRKGSPRKGRTDPKTDSGIRSLVVPTALASAIDRYIAENHGAAPDRETDPRCWEDWHNSYLLTGIQGGPMNSGSFTAALNAAYKELGLNPETFGRFRPVHHWRKSVGARLQDPKQQLTGPAVAEFLGHEHPNRNDKDVSDVTAKHYNPLTAGALDQLYRYLEDWTNQEIVACIQSGDLLELDELADPIPVAEATRIYRKFRPGSGEDDIQQMVASGQLPARKIKHGSGSQCVVVDRKTLDGLISDAVRAESDSYSAPEVCELIACDRAVLDRLVADGALIEVTDDLRARRRGTRGCGGLPGGGRRFSKASVDNLVATGRESIHRRRTWLTVSETAALIGAGPDTVRRHLTSLEWRDPWTSHRRRYYDPVKVAEWVAEHREIAVAEAASLMGTGPAYVRLQVKLGTIRRGRSRLFVRAIDVERYIDSTGDGQGVGS